MGQWAGSIGPLKCTQGRACKTLLLKYLNGSNRCLKGHTKSYNLTREAIAIERNSKRPSANERKKPSYLRRGQTRVEDMERKKEKRMITVSNTGPKRNIIKYSLSFSRQTKGATGIDFLLRSKRLFIQKRKIVYSPTNRSKSCLTFFLMWNIKEDILKNIATFF